MRKLLCFNPFTPLFFISAFQKKSDIFEFYTTTLTFDSTQKAISKYLFEKNLVQEANFDSRDTYLLCHCPLEIDLYGPIKVSKITADIEIVERELFGAISFVDQLFCSCATMKRVAPSIILEFLPFQYQNLHDFFLAVFSIGKGAVEEKISCLKRSAFSSTISETLLKALKSGKSTTLLSIGNLMIELDFLDGIKAINNIRSLSQMNELINNNFPEDIKDIDCIVLKNNPENLRFAKESLLFFGFNSIRNANNLTDFISQVSSSNTTYIYAIKPDELFCFNVFGDLKNIGSFVVQLKSVFFHSSTIHGEIGCEEYNFNFSFFKARGSLIHDIMKFSPCFFIYRRDFLLRIYEHLIKKLGSLEFLDIPSFLLVSATLEPSPTRIENILLLKRRTVKSKIPVSDCELPWGAFKLMEVLDLVDKNTLDECQKYVCKWQTHIIINQPNLVLDRESSGLEIINTSKIDPKVSIITCLYNNFSLTKKFLTSLKSVSDPTPFEIVLIDNASSDSTRDELMDFLHSLGLERLATVIFSDININFSGGNNVGSKFAKGDFLLFLNNDMECMDGFISALIETFRHDRVGIVGAKLLYPVVNTIQHAGVGFGYPFGFVHVFRNCNSEDPMVNLPRDLQAVTGACIMIPKQLFFDLGGFDTVYLNELEDVDLCLKVKSMGLRVIYQPKAVLIHHESKSPGRMSTLKFLRNLEYLLSKWHGKFEEDLGDFLTNKNSIREIPQRS
ncbi:MAG: glycosyltransferase family 2 protein [Deltaproteobacteria bacterium]|nr:glycosyltransferase family 2 protein [Deltaproteobacteria bacterium]